MSKISFPTLIVAVLVVLILLTYMCTYQVDFYEVAIKVRLGQADEQSVIREPGLKLRWPYPIEQIEEYDTRLRTLDTPETEIKTIDGKNVIIGSYAVWNIADPLLFYQRVESVEDAERQMRSRISQVQAAVIGQEQLSSFVNLDADLVDRNYEALLAQIEDDVAPGLMDDYGISVRDIGIRRISLPAETTQQVFESMKQERNRLATEYREEGKSEAAGIVARAEQQAKQVLAFADRKAEEIRSAGVEASTRLLAQIEQQDARFYELLRWYDALEAALKQKTTFFIDQTSPLFDPFVNPPVGAEIPTQSGE